MPPKKRAVEAQTKNVEAKTDSAADSNTASLDKDGCGDHDENRPHKRSMTTAVLSFILALSIGIILGAYVSIYLIESEYREIVSQFQVGYKATIVRIQTDLENCQESRVHEREVNENELAELLAISNSNERAFLERAERYLKETNHAYEVANEGLSAASLQLEQKIKAYEQAQVQLSGEMEAHKVTKNNLDGERNAHQMTRYELQQVTEERDIAHKTIGVWGSRLGEEIHAHQSTQAKLATAINEHATAINEHDATKLSLTQVEQRLSAINNTMANLTAELEVAREANEVMQIELDEAEEDLDRRDLERAECDENFRKLSACQGSLNDEMENRNIDVSQLRRQLALAQDSLENVDVLAAKRERLFAEGIASVRDERNMWQDKTAFILKRLNFKATVSVLEHFGEGPHRVRLTMKFPTEPTMQSIVFEFAPLNSLPHVIETALNIFHDKSLNGGTFIMSRGHILVFGPVDPHDEENNSRLEQKMVDVDLFPEGALMFTEYTPEQPHSQYTVGFNARGPVMYINMVDNTARHGPESRKDPDPCFARVVEGVDVIQRIAQVPTLEDDSLEYPVYIVDSEVLS